MMSDKFLVRIAEALERIAPPESVDLNFEKSNAVS